MWIEGGERKMQTKKCAFGAVVVVATAVAMYIGVFGGIGLLSPHHDPTPIPDEVGICEENAPHYLDAISKKPDDFDSVVTGEGANICELEEGYYLQPDFYADSWKVGKPRYTEHDYSRWRVHGYGAYPCYPKVAFASNREGVEKQTCTLYRTAWGIETWQGLELVPEKSEYFEVVVTPHEVLLPPAFPRFEEGWAKKLNITVKIKNPPPSNATYKIKINAVAPSKEKSREWKEKVSNKEISRPQVEMMIKECEEQNEREEKGLNCKELINLRRNKYIEGGYIDVGGRLIIVIVVGGEDEK